MPDADADAVARRMVTLVQFSYQLEPGGIDGCRRAGWVYGRFDRRHPRRQEAVVKDLVDPSGEITKRCVMAEHAPIAVGELCFKLVEVVGDGTGRSIVGVAEPKRPVRRSAIGVIFVFVTEVMGLSGAEAGQPE